MTTASNSATVASMNEYNGTVDADAAADLLRSTAGPVVIFTHAKPDGDAFGSVIALTATLRSLGKQAVACFVPPVPANLADMPGADLAEIYRNGETQLPDAALYVILDTGAWSQVGPLGEIIKANLHRTLIIDHHLSGDVPAAHRFIDGEAAATCEILAPVIDSLLGGKLTTQDETLTRAILDGLFVGIASDTGWFRFSNARPRTHELAARLLRHGVDHAEIYRRLEQTERPEKLALLIRALDSLKLVADRQAAIMSLHLSDFEETGAFEEETERLIDIPQQVGTIQIIVLASESRRDPNNSGNATETVGSATDAGAKASDTTTRLSFRSKPGPNAINVAELAQQFGGGGHARAAALASRPRSAKPCPRSKPPSKRPSRPTPPADAASPRRTTSHIPISNPPNPPKPGQSESLPGDERPRGVARIKPRAASLQSLCPALASAIDPKLTCPLPDSRSSCSSPIDCARAPQHPAPYLVHNLSPRVARLSPSWGFADPQFR